MYNKIHFKNNEIHFLPSGIFIRWKSKAGDYFFSSLKLVLKYGKKQIQKEIHELDLETPKSDCITPTYADLEYTDSFFEN